MVIGLTIDVVESSTDLGLHSLPGKQTTFDDEYIFTQSYISLCSLYVNDNDLNRDIRRFVAFPI